MFLKIPIATGLVPAGEGKMDTTTANAFAAPESSGTPIDLSAYQDGRHLYWAQDSAGKVACGWISATAPGGESAPVELNGDPGFASDAYWVKDTASETIAGGKAVFTASGNREGIAHLSLLTLGALYLTSFDIDSISSGGISVYAFNPETYQTTTGTKTKYLTSNAGLSIGLVASSTAPTTATCDNLSIKRVTDCAATGALLLSTQGGSRGYLNKDSDFNPNLALRFEIFKIIESNPIVEASATTLWVKTPMYVNMIEWVDDNGDIVHDSTLVLNINGVPLTVKVQPLADVLGTGAVIWRMGPFNPGIPISDFTITTMATGKLHVWFD